MNASSDPGTAVPAAIALPRSARLVATLALMLASGMQAADATIANVALPQLEQQLGGGLALGAWVMTGYLCANAVAAPLTGALRRRWGPRGLFAAAVGGFTGASLLCAAAPSSGALILFRVLQGAGGGIMHPLAQAILLDLYPRERHGRMLAIWGATIMTGPIIGPALGGIITDLASWRWVFVINLPLGAAAMLAMSRVLPERERTGDLSVDFTGVVLLSAGIGALQLCLERGLGRAWLASPELIAETAIAAAAFVGIALRVRADRFAVFRPAVFRDINFAAAAFYNFISSALMFVSIVFIPAVVEGPLGENATLAGATIVPRGVAMMLSMLLAGQLIGRVELRAVLFAGLGLLAAGLIMLSAVAAAPASALPLIIVGSSVQSIGVGLLFTSLSTVGFSTLPPGLRTEASGVYSLLRQLGCASGVALMTAVLRLLMAGGPLSHAAAAGHAAGAAALNAYCQCFRIMAAASLLVIPGIFLFRMPHAAAAPDQAAGAGAVELRRGRLSR
ncbi:MAG TPA: DHA2 family efflux MFS transporter permease subunit [Stellaceae bacterium]|nr:DHA2 family efflux MFS transporter permease subunit [Stellaceae bacterium]